jgi:hypothetical protein
MTTKNALVILLVVIGLGIIAADAVDLFRTKDSVMCTMEARQCPDGSYVGRTGPKCEFSACPEVNPVLGWKTSTNTTRGIEFKYPETLPFTYIHPVDWPPAVSVQEGPFSCLNAGSETARAGKTETQTIRGHEYCVTRISEGAAGSIYTQYAYVFPKSGKVAIFTFSLRSVQCANYDEPQRAQCDAERVAFDIGSMIDTMAGTLSI